MTTEDQGYSKLSIALHWITAISVIALFVTHEGERGSTAMMFHVGGGAVLGGILIWRVIRRPLRGFAEKPKQPAILNIISTLVLWALLIAIFVVTITGYLLPWSIGRPLEIFSVISIPSFMEGSRELHEALEDIHDAAGHVIVPLVLLHILGALKHLTWDKDGVMQRILRPIRNGR